MALISVIIPAYNSENSILKSLESVVSQNLVDEIEVVVVNDGSTDNTKFLVENFIEENKHVDLKLINQKNQGVASARNNGVNASSGRFIAFLDSDDIWKDGKLKKQLKFLTTNPDFHLVATNFNGLNLNTKRLLDLNEGYFSVTFENILFKHYFQPSTVLMTRESFSNVGGFKNGMTHAEEGLLFLNVSYNYKCAIDSNISIVYGEGKHAYATSGLASNLTKMQLGELHNYRQIYLDGKIDFLKYLVLTSFSICKYLRRVMIKLVKGG